MENISISLSEGGYDREVSEIRVDGVIDTMTATELEQVIDSLLRRDRYKIVIDLAGVEYISSAGWGIFISHIKDVRANDGDIKLVNMVPDVYEIFELLEFDKVLRVHSSVDQAVEKFGGGKGHRGQKKKAARTRLTVIEDISPAAGSSSGGSLHTHSELAATLEDLELFVLQMTKKDPFVTISEIRQEFEQQTFGQRAGWWRIFFVLRKNGLLRKRSRFRYAWGRS